MGVQSRMKAPVVEEHERSSPARAARHRSQHAIPLHALIGSSTAGTPLAALEPPGMRGRLGSRFSDVRVHSGATASSVAQELGTRAFTLGRHIYVGSDAPALTTSAGQRLLAHELGHVSQSPRHAEVGDGTAVVDASPMQELMAHVTGGRLLAGRDVVAPALSFGPLVLGREQLFAQTAADQVEQLIDGAPSLSSGAVGEAIDYLSTLEREDLVDTLVVLDGRRRLERIAGELAAGDRSELAAAVFAVMFLSTQHRSTPSWGIVAASVIASLPPAARLGLLEQVLRSTGRGDEIDGIREGFAAFEESETALANEPETVVDPGTPPITTMAGVPIGPWNPGQQPIPFYLGNAAHVAIAAYYATQHPTDAAFYNFTPISMIAAAAARLGITLGTATATASQLGLKPDIANLTLLHLYEIKPTTLQGLGRAEALLYQSAFAAAGLAIQLGAAGEKGTSGTIPAPGGWYVFRVAEPGVITYSYRQPPRVRVRVPSLAPAPAPDRSLKQRISELTGLTGTALIVYIIISEGSRVVIPPRNLIPVP